CHREMSSLPRATSQILAVLSQLPETRRWPSGLKATLWMSPLCPRRVANCCQVAASQTITDALWSPEARRRPSRLKATHLTDELWPRKLRTFWPFVTSQIHTVPSQLA